MICERIIYKRNQIKILDQRLLPFKIKYYTATNSSQIAKAIKDMMVRGAPLIGDTAAFGFLLGIDEIIRKKITDKKKII